MLTNPFVDAARNLLFLVIEGKIDNFAAVRFSISGLECQILARPFTSGFESHIANATFQIGRHGTSGLQGLDVVGRVTVPVFFHLRT